MGNGATARQNRRRWYRQTAQSDELELKKRWQGAHLINEVLAMVVAELLGADYAVEVCFHELLDEVDLLEVV